MRRRKKLEKRGITELGRVAANYSFENDDAPCSSDSIQPIPPVFTEERRAPPLSADVVGLQALNCMRWCSAARTHGSPLFLVDPKLETPDIQLKP